MAALRRVADALTALSERITTALLIAVALLGLANLFMRVFLRMGIPEATEADGIAVVVIAFLGMARGFFEDSHVRLSMIERALSGDVRARLQQGIKLLSLLTLLILVTYGIYVTWLFSRRTLAATSMPWLSYWMPELSIPLGAALGFIALLVTQMRTTGKSEIEPL